MANYYVRTDGNNANSGIGQAPNQAWQTISYALANMVLANGVNYLYIAPGVYRESPTVVITPSSTQTLVIQGDATCSIFSGTSAGEVKITNYTSDSAVPTYATAFTCAKQYVTLRNIHFEIFGNISFTNSNYCSVIQCVFNCVVRGNSTNQGTVRVQPPSNVPSNFTADRCVFTGSQGLQLLQFDGLTNFSHNALITRCLFLCKIGIANLNNPALASYGGGYTVWNCTFICNESGIASWSSNTTDKVYVYNSLFYALGDYGQGIATVSGSSTIENYNRFVVQTRGGATGGVNSLVGTSGMSLGYESINGLLDVSLFAPSSGSPLLSAGLVAGAPSTDINSDSWISGVDVGAYERVNLSLQSYYLPTERNTSAISIIPNSTSQSIEIYLGATGLTFATSGLSAYYIRNRSSPVQISLISQTPTGSWASGGFAEISSTNAPGVYRLDVPNAAFASGSDDVTIVVRGAAGSNGAVVTCTLFNPTANLLNTQAGIYTSAGTLGARLLQTVADNRPVIVTSANQIQVDAGQTFSSGSGTTILDPILNSVGRWTLEGSTLTLYNADGTYLRRCNLSQLGLSLSPT
jgi:hypothetical protein